MERIRSEFEARCEKAGIDPDAELHELIGDEDPEDFWTQVKTNLQAGKIRLLFVADAIPDELRRIVEFLNEQMDPAEVVAVQVRRFASEAVQTLVPQVVGATSKKGGGGRPTREWDEESFFRALKKKGSENSVKVARRYIKWAKEHLPRMAFGKGAINGAMTGVLDYEGHNHYPVWLFTDGNFQLQFPQMAKHPPFDREEARQEMVAKLIDIPGVELPEDAVNRYPLIWFEALTKGDAMDRFMEVMEWYVAQINETPTDE